ncbi:MAG: cell division protein ZapE [Rickettsiales bacterium]|jgi:cell division protein ZapE|nr:cell division protein ZapE [Rickettsiales bacterium]
MNFTSKNLSNFAILKQYYYACKANEINYDSCQVAILKKFEKFRLQITKFHLFKKDHPVGIYVYGNVGIGKTYLSSLLYENVDLAKKRIHLHEFMYLIYESLNDFRKTAKANQDPLILAARKIAKEYKFIFFDEFLIHDPADALIMHKLFKELIKQKVKFVITSNFAPDDLYKDGLQRNQFQEFIDLMHREFLVMNLDIKSDYRRKKIKGLKRTYLHPITQDNDAEFKAIFGDLTAYSSVSDHKLMNKSREINIPVSASKTAMFDFDDLCNAPLGTKDFQIIADHYSTIFIKNIPSINNNDNELARRFINMIDIFYNIKTNVIFYAEVKVEELYDGTKLKFEFSRAISRIKEMQTSEYQDFA